MTDQGPDTLEYTHGGVFTETYGSSHGLRVSILEEKHMVSTILFLYGREGCMKTELYTNVSSNPKMPMKLDRLEEAGLIMQMQTEGSRAVVLSLTETGRKVARSLQEIDGILEKERVQDD